MATDFMVHKTKLYLMYCCHLSFYFILKSNRSSIENHPVIKNILQYRNVSDRLTDRPVLLDLLTTHHFGCSFQALQDNRPH